MMTKALNLRPLRVSIIASIILFTFTVITTHAAEMRPVTVEDILSMNRVSDPRIAPDGSKIAYVVTEANLEKNINDSDIWIVATDVGEPFRLTRGPEKDDTPRWSHTGTKVAFLSDRAGKNQIFVIQTSGGDAIQLTEHETGVSSFEWSPDDNSMAYLAEVPLTEDDEKKRKESPVLVDSDYRYQQVWRIELETKETRQIVDEDIHVSEIAWSPDGQTFAVAGRPTPRLKDYKYSNIYTVPAQGGKLHEIPTGPMPRSAPHFLSNGKLIYQSKNGLGAFNTRLYVADAQGANSRAITEHHDENASFLGSSKDGNLVYFRSRSKTTSDVYVVSAAGGKPRRITNGDMVLTGASLSGDTETLAVVGHTSTTPPDVYVSFVESFVPKKLTTIHPQADELVLGQQEVISWKSVDGLEIEGVLIRPIGYEVGKKYPLLLLIHGGPSGVWSNGYNIRNSAYPTQVFAGQGYAILMPNPRGSGGYGESHRRGNFQDLSGKEWDDCITGVDAVIEMGIGDPDRLGIMGWSYGGHLTYWGITQTDRFKAGSAGAGANNLVSMYSQTDLPGFYSDTYFGFPPWNRFDFYWERSSLSHVAEVKTPLLIQVGENDRRVPKTQSIEFYTALRDLGVPTELVIYSRQPHGVREPKLVLDLLQRNVDWFKKWVLEGGQQSTNP